MKKLKTYVSLFLTFLMVIPCMFIFSACGKKVNKLSNDELSLTVSGGNFKKGTTLDAYVVKENTREYSKATESVEGKEYNTELELYIISLEATLKDKIVQPKSSVTISIPAPFVSEYGYVVYQVFDDSTTKEIEVVEKNDKISFATDSFSIFVVAGQREDFLLFELDMEKNDNEDENIKTVSFYSLRKPTNKSNLIKIKQDGIFNKDSIGLYAEANNILILTSTGYKNCVIGTIANRKGSLGFYTYNGSFTAKMSVDKNYGIFYIENSTNVLTKVESNKVISHREGRYIIVRTETYNSLLKSGVNNDGSLYAKLTDMSSPKKDESGNTTYEDLTASYEVWIQFSTDVKKGNA